TDLNDNLRIDWEFDQALNGNIALTGELDWHPQVEFTIGLAFGDSLQNAISTLLQSLGVTFEEQLDRYSEQRIRTCINLLPQDALSGDGGHLYRSSYSLLLSHEDKSYPGALIASLSIPWGEAKGDEDMGGYHLVWTRDMYNSATGLLASGDAATPLRA